MKLVFGVFLLAITSNVLADYFDPEWHSKCLYKDKSFEIGFKSKSGDVTEDDMEASITTTNGEIKILPFPKALYAKSNLTATLKNLCDLTRSPGVAAFHISEKNVLLFISKDDRPSLNILFLALINIETGEVLDQLDTGKELKSSQGIESFTIKEHKNKLNIRLVTEYLENTGGDSIDNFIESWVEVDVLSNKISIK